MCRFPHDPPVPAVVRVSMDRGCVCYPDDREQDLCVQHDYKSEPLGTYEVIREY